MRIASVAVGQAILATSLAAQAHTGAIQGRVIDTAGRPVASVDASLANTRLRAISDSSGRFLLADIPPGLYALVLRRVGFDRLQLTANVFADDTIEADITLHANVTRLDTVVTAGTAPLSQEAADVNALIKSGLGILFDSTEIARHSGDHVSDLLRNKVNGITFKERRGCGGLALAANNGVGLPVDLKNGVSTIRQGACTAPDACYFQIFVDGMRVYSYDRSSLPPDIDGIADLSLVQTIQVYPSGARTPPQYNSTGSACGTIVIRLKR